MARMQIFTFGRNWKGAKRGSWDDPAPVLVAALRSQVKPCLSDLAAAWMLGHLVEKRLTCLCVAQRARTRICACALVCMLCAFYVPLTLPTSNSGGVPVTVRVPVCENRLLPAIVIF